ncbi:hypothetical protein L6E12_08200 [Actinokineospora sp. PR83]|uniref:hypothetical protein n=1 Tax=Actinokineospora sp. PR83 TaxID=2884908 RepID=UPI001F37BCAE|nr:hypothetical protein [Actinokineospora sp. PR83]MCG8915768.1 hypothetical protein [Actinokineospora sp. PR83]
MRLIRLPVAVLTIALAAACGTDAAPPPPTTPAAPAPRWVAASPGIPPDRLTSLEGGAGWDRGFVLAGHHLVPAAPNSRGQVNDLVSDVYTSPDGGTWAPAALDGIRQLGHQTPVAGHRGTAYVLGATTSGAAVWRSEDGVSWSALPLAGSEPGEALSAVAAGPRGVVVVGFDRPMAVLDTDRIDNRDHDGLRVWHSTDGKTFTGPDAIDAPGLRSGYLPDVTATADGFTVFGVTGDPDSGTTMLSSADGTEWTTDDPGPVRGRVLSLTRKDDLTVLFTDPTTTDGDLGPTAWRRGTGDWTASHDVTVGVLPDANVDKPEAQRIRQVTAWRGWLIATGSSSGGGGVWLSSDAARWERVPVKQNGFGTAGSLSAFTNNTTALLAGDASDGGPLRIWTSA